MNDNSTLCSPRETFFLILILMTNRLFTNFPIIHNRVSGTGASLSAGISVVIAWLLIYFIATKFFVTGNENIITKTEKIFGKAGKVVLSLLLAAYLLVSSFYQLTEITDFAKLTAFPTAPFPFIAGFFAAAAVIGALSGAKALFRTSGYIIISFGASLLLLLSSALFQSDFTNLFPMLGTGSVNVFRGGFAGTTMFSDIILLFILKPSFKTDKSARRTVLSAAGVSLGIAFLVILAYTAKIPYPVSSNEHFPLFLLLKEASFGSFFQRTDALFLFSSSIFGMFSLSLNIFLISQIFRQTFGIKPRHITIIPTALILYCIAITSFRFSVPFMIYSGATAAAVFLFAILPYRKERLTSNES